MIVQNMTIMEMKHMKLEGNRYRTKAKRFCQTILFNKENLDNSFRANSSNNENLNESSAEEGNEDLKSKIPELTSKKFIRDSGTIRDQLWIVPYKQSEMINLSIPSTLSFPLRKVDCNNEYIVILDNLHNLWALK